MTRLISHSEASTLLSCEARHDFRYVGQLAGTALRRKASRPILRDGRAWGAGVAAMHSHALQTDALVLGHQAIDASLEEDADEQRELGLHDPAEFAEQQQTLHGLLDHYAATTDPLPIETPERELQVPIPSRTGRRRSNAYRLQCFMDGVHIDPDGRVWIVEYKLRKRLTDLWLISLSRQIRWEAWAWREHAGVEVAGVIVDERLKQVPKPARMLANGQPSHAKDQLTTPHLYREACARARACEPSPDTIEALAQRRWQQRERVIFRPGELDEAGRQLVSVARQVNDFDSGRLFPVRNPSQPNCAGCDYRDICGNPDDVDLVEMLYERVEAKRDRETNDRKVAA